MVVPAIVVLLLAVVPRQASGLAASVLAGANEEARAAPQRGGLLAAVKADLRGLLDVTHVWPQGVGFWTFAVKHRDDILDPEGGIKDTLLLSWTETAAVSITWIVLSVVAAFLYHTHKAPQPISPELNKSTEHEKFKTWQVGMFDCLFSGNVSLCFWSCCCPAVQVADSVSILQLASFWVAFTVILALMVLDFLTVELSFIVLTAILVYYRQRIRKAFEIESGGLTLVTDCCCYCFCRPCLIAQEAMQVRKAAECGHPAVHWPDQEAKEDSNKPSA